MSLLSHGINVLKWVFKGISFQYWKVRFERGLRKVFFLLPKLYSLFTDDCPLCRTRTNSTFRVFHRFQIPLKNSTKHIAQNTQKQWKNIHTMTILQRNLLESWCITSSILIFEMAKLHHMKYALLGYLKY